MKKPPHISICIANYNGIDIIDDCLESIITQTGELAVEIIVHDDASSDESVAHIRKHYPGVQIIESDDNVGFCIANNRMAAIARGEYLLLLNNDAALYPDALKTLHNAAVEIKQPAILSLPQYNYSTGEILDRGCLLDPFLNPIPNLDHNRSDAGMVMGACLWIPKTLWHELEGFPEWFGSIGEDLYLCCRARLAGYIVQPLHTSGYRHRVGNSFGGGKLQTGRLSTTLQRRRLSERNKTFTIALIYPGILLACVLPVHLILLMLEGFIITSLTFNISIWQEIYQPLIPTLWQKRKHLNNLRRKIQETRKVSTTTFLSTFSWLPRKLDMLFRYGLPKLR